MGGGMANQTIRTPEKEGIILAALRERPVFSYAITKARIGRQAFYDWRHDDPAFEERLLAARQQGIDAIEDSLTRRALSNDTTAAIFLLKSLRPTVYGDRVKVTHGGTLTHQHQDLSLLSDDELRQLRALAMKIEARQVAG
jgi:hypothetical protein